MCSAHGARAPGCLTRSRIRARTGPRPAALSLSCVLLVTSSIAAPTRLHACSQRLAAQEALERVYWKHRTWPAGDASKRPGFEQAVPEAVIRARVEDYLRKSEALERESWKRPITAVREPGRPEDRPDGGEDPGARSASRELFDALDDDPEPIAKCWHGRISRTV